jgi:uncharacterized protein YerC
MTFTVPRGPIPGRKRGQYISSKKVSRIQDMLNAGCTQRTIVANAGTSTNTIMKVKRGEYYDISC